MSIEREKQLAAEAAAELVEDGMTVGLGDRVRRWRSFSPPWRAGTLDIRCVATSPRTERAARELGFGVETFADIDRFDMTIDGADQIAPDGWLVKGGGAAHTREKIVAAAARPLRGHRRLVQAGGRAAQPPIPLELLAFGLRATDPRLGAGGAAETSR